mmetsp:Transcript_12493/g.25080  ORF Transcript_12493/g.25080 Transcript_12493/m.25080 type:complete len:212 (+) Transcript_12493:185-820(+)
MGGQLRGGAAAAALRKETAQLLQQAGCRVPTTTGTLPSVFALADAFEQGRGAELHRGCLPLTEEGDGITAAAAAASGTAATAAAATPAASTSSMWERWIERGAESTLCGHPGGTTAARPSGHADTFTAATLSRLTERGGCLIRHPTCLGHCHAAPSTPTAGVADDSVVVEGGSNHVALQQLGKKTRLIRRWRRGLTRGWRRLSFALLVYCR